MPFTDPRREAFHEPNAARYDECDDYDAHALGLRHTQHHQWQQHVGPAHTHRAARSYHDPCEHGFYSGQDERYYAGHNSYNQYHDDPYEPRLPSYQPHIQLSDASLLGEDDWGAAEAQEYGEGEYEDEYEEREEYEEGEEDQEDDAWEEADEGEDIQQQPQQLQHPHEQQQQQMQPRDDIDRGTLALPAEPSPQQLIRLHGIPIQSLQQVTSLVSSILGPFGIEVENVKIGRPKPAPASASEDGAGPSGQQWGSRNVYVRLKNPAMTNRAKLLFEETKFPQLSNERAAMLAAKEMEDLAAKAKELEDLEQEHHARRRSPEEPPFKGGGAALVNDVMPRRNASGAAAAPQRRMQRHSYGGYMEEDPLTRSGHQGHMRDHGDRQGVRGPGYAQQRAQPPPSAAMRSYPASTAMRPSERAEVRGRPYGHLHQPYEDMYDPPTRGRAIPAIVGRKQGGVGPAAGSGDMYEAKEGIQQAAAERAALKSSSRLPYQHGQAHKRVEEPNGENNTILSFLKKYFTCPCLNVVLVCDSRLITYVSFCPFPTFLRSPSFLWRCGSEGGSRPISERHSLL